MFTSEKFAIILLKTSIFTFFDNFEPFCAILSTLVGAPLNPWPPNLLEIDITVFFIKKCVQRSPYK